MSNAGVKRRNLKVNVIYNFISQILTLIVPIITTPYLSRVLHEAGNGQYSYVFSIATYFILFASLGFDLYGQRQIAGCGEDVEKKSNTFWELFVLKSMLTALSLAIMFALAFSGIIKASDRLIFMIFSIQVLAVPFDIQFLFKGEEDFKSIAVRSIVMRLIGLVSIFVFVKGEGDVWIYALCISVSTIASNLIIWPSALRRVKAVKIKTFSLWRHFGPAFFIFLPTLAATIYSVSDKTMIGILAENALYENGCYEEAYKINSVALLLVTIISSVMVSRNARDFSEGKHELVKEHLYAASSYVWMMGLPLIAGFAALSENLSSWFLGAGYEKVPLLMKIMSVRFVLSGFSEILGGQLFIAIGKEKYGLIASFSAAAVNLLLNFFLIPIMGATGAAIATAVCEAVVTLVYLILAAAGKYLSVAKMTLLGWKYLLAAGAMFVLIYFLQTLLPYAIWSFLLIVLAGASFYALCLFLLRDKFFLKQVRNVFSALFKRKKKPAEETAPAEGLEEMENNVDGDGKDDERK